MKHKILTGAALALLTLPGQAADLTETISKAIDDGKVSLSFRYRYEFVDEDGFDEDANANTLKSRLTFAPEFNTAWSAVVEFDDVRHIGSPEFNDTRNGNTNFPTVSDPRGTDLNQALIRYTGFADTALTAGRQRIDRADQRFVGGVSWRQNEQTYDSISAAYGESGPIQLYYAYVYQVNRVFGPQDGVPTRKFDSDSHLAEISYKAADLLKISGYTYLMDFKNGDVFSTASYGARLDGATNVGEDMRFRYIAEVARQTDYGDNPVDYSADYYRLEAGFEWSVFGAEVGYEVLGGSSTPGGGFRTPLATLFKWQGWADRFLLASAAGIDEGIKDARVGLTAKLIGAKWELYYHDFTADVGNQNWGSEIDASASWSFSDHYGVLLRLARYDNDDYIAGDITKAWVQLTANF